MLREHNRRKLDLLLRLAHILHLRVGSRRPTTRVGLTHKAGRRGMAGLGCRAESKHGFVTAASSTAHLERRAAKQELVGEDAQGPYVHLQHKHRKCSVVAPPYMMPVCSPRKCRPCHVAPATHLAAVVAHLVGRQAQPLDGVWGGHAHHLRRPGGPQQLKRSMRGKVCSLIVRFQAPWRTGQQSTRCCTVQGDASPARTHM